MEIKFPNILRAVKRSESSSWEIADGLLKEASDRDTGADGLNAVVDELMEHGFEYTTRYLRLLRQTAETFSKNRRHDGVSIRTHAAAGNPDTLDVIMKVARKERHPLSKEYIEDVMRRLRLEERERRAEERETIKKEIQKAEHDAAHAETKRKLAASKDAEEDASRQRKDAIDRKRDAQKRLRQKKSTPNRRTLPAPKEEEVTPLAAKAFFARAASEARRLADKSMKELKPHLASLSPAAAGGLVDAALTVANAWRETASAIQKSTGRGRGHLSAVNE